MEKKNVTPLALRLADWIGDSIPNESIISLLGGIRTCLQVVAEPIDWFDRILTNKRGYPPLWLRQHVGDLSDFEGSCGEYVAYLKVLCNLNPGDNLLDVGCGCGLILMGPIRTGALLNYIKPGNYVGMDIDKKSINWCKRNIKYPNCSFVALPSGEGDALPVASGSFDAILAKSLFTHLLPCETVNYLREFKRLLKPGRKCLSTWFLLTGQGLTGRFPFKYRNGEVAYERATKPRKGVAYQLDWVLGVIKQVGLTVELVKYGTWSGRQDGLSDPDVIILKK